MTSTDTASPRTPKSTILFIGPMPEPVTGHSLACKVFYDELVKRHHVELVNLSKGKLNGRFGLVGRVFEVMRILAEVWWKRGKADAIYFTVSESVSGNLKDILIYLLCFRKLGRMVIHLHGGQGFRDLMQGRLHAFRRLNHLVAQRVACAIVLGERHVDIYEGVLPREKIRIVPNFAEDYLFSSATAIDAKFSAVQPLRLLFLSNLLPGKGYIELVEAYRALGDASKRSLSIDIAGAFESKLDERAFLRSISNLPGIKYHGPVYGKSKQALFQQAHVFCLPTYYAYEGQPISLLEAYAAGCAVITTGHSGINDVFTDGINGLQVSARSVESLRDAISTAIGAPARLHQMALNNLDAAEARHRTTGYNAALAGILDEVLRPGLPTRPGTHAREYQICTNCIMDTSDAGIVFDERGRCDYCVNHQRNIATIWSDSGDPHAASFARTIERIRRHGRRREHDCLIGISGGVDSSYLALVAKEQLGLRPLLYHVDTGWNSQESANNIERIVDGLGLDLQTEVVDWNEMRDLQLAFFKAQVPHLDTPQDHAIFGGLYNFAARNKFRYILTGANYASESIKEPLEWHYHATDLRQLKAIHRKFGSRPLKTFPLTSIFRYRIYYRFAKRMEVVKPLNHVAYNKDTAAQLLADRFGWQRYTHKHHESRFTQFYEGYWLPVKFGYDKRRAHFSSLILSGQMTREEALRQIALPPYDRETINRDVDYVARKLGISVAELREIMNGPNKTYRDYANSAALIALGARVLRAVGVERRIVR